MNEVQKFLRLAAVIEVTGRSRNTILRGAKDGSFPSPVHVSPRAIAWIPAEVAKWQKNASTRVKEEVRCQAMPRGVM
ncbi:AlpA family phage regulatory protein [Janthinobacterium sp. 64]|uniref:AlpA family phage regulatory protein n=1 Tax=Janthinobacterium sp. 64 TaxID=2035208 RepID=UPI0012FDACA9|nr:AlpA family phage regulatory protein [Janthinobacterium sp. 64]